MTYTQLGILMVLVAVLIDLFVLRTRLVTRRGFWVAYVIVLFFQLITNGILTGIGAFRYADDAIVGQMPADGGPPPMFGEGRVVFQPFEDLLMGFSLCLLAMALWIYWGRRGVQRTPMAGPPRWRSGRWARTAPTRPAGADPRGPGDRDAAT
ncbi:MAG: hypothetical protein VW082_10875 [Candidatus Nanopelagicales bacterium]|jgi:lycopene cyclase domain-containing protein